MKYIFLICLLISDLSVFSQTGNKKPMNIIFILADCSPSMYLTATDSGRTYGIVTTPETKVNYQDIPKWVRNQRYSWHGVDYMYHGTIKFDDFYHCYLETLQAVDKSIERVFKWIQSQGLQDNTMVVYMGDNGFFLLTKV